MTTDTRNHSRQMIDAAREALTELATGWAEMGTEAARQMREANRMAVYESKMDHIDLMINDVLHRREILEAKCENAPDVLKRVYAAQMQTLDAELGRFAGEAERIASAIRGDMEVIATVVAADVPALGAAPEPEDEEDAGTVKVSAHRRKKPAKA